MLSGVIADDSGQCCRVPAARVTSIVRALLIPFINVKMPGVFNFFLIGFFDIDVSVSSNN